MSDKQFTEKDVIEAFVTGWCSSRGRGKLTDREKASNITKRVARGKAKTWISQNE